jgi:glutathione S-transferase
MPLLSFENPTFVAFATASAIMMLKAVAMSWLTVARMMWFRSGFRSPEDLKRTLLNPTPHADQLLPDERVERVRRIQQNDLENLPFFFASGGLYVLTAPPLGLAQWLFYGYAISRLLHFAAYFSGQVHDIRASLWTVGSLIIIFMTCASIVLGIGKL